MGFPREQYVGEGKGGFGTSHPGLRSAVGFLQCLGWHLFRYSAPYFERFMNLIKDEPWVFGLPDGGEREYLGEFGLELREVFTIGSEESLKRYVTKADGTQVGAQTIAGAMARMAQHGSPPQPRRGVCAIKKKSRSILCSRRRGGVIQRFSDHTTPSAPSKEASRLLLDVAATPPRLRRGARVTTPDF